ncbi:unnamed protein product [Didymodactylos carnosus]|uniref:Metal-independent alpha-mannosidase n=1 Tax=Didymodactylos carnosus TaxID=1234261 RepID=A0A813UZU4_9BILA|nr:unnamed protein product [Didymodactylos carnosus]CAF0838992.1 unnamed protein product [Didymodactylos carnosus]CAF3621062.1 unnamed protein product [Didymodactylos carnosus]CAF3623900.1 unnamed protein product [Didymodactylos carnosus]
MKLLSTILKYLPKLINKSFHVEWCSKIKSVLRGHIMWLFKRAQRLDQGHWGRSYLTNGQCKDKIFQLDQQCYPLLELCQYYDLYQEEKGDCIELVNMFVNQIDEVLTTILACKHPEKWIFSTDETPGDDPVQYPYHFSSQILLWYTLKQLEQRKFVKSFDLTYWIENLYRDCLECFRTNHPENQNKFLFAYVADNQNSYHHFYHDANDLPTVYAPLWQFCSHDDEAWLNTMEFAFSPLNKDGFYVVGLGSVHTRHPWPLGDAQELLYAHLINDETRQRRLLNRLTNQIIQWDGLYSEAVDENDHKVTSRHWFSWPGAVISIMFLNYYF